MEEKKIGYMVAGSLLLFAGAIDGTQALFNLITAVPIVGWIVGPPSSWYFSVVGGVVLSCWFYYLQVPFVGRIGTAVVIEFIPVVNAIPAYTAATLLTIIAANNPAVGTLLSAVSRGGVAGKAASVSSATDVAATATSSKDDVPQPKKEVATKSDLAFKNEPKDRQQERQEQQDSQVPNINKDVGGGTRQGKPGQSADRPRNTGGQNSSEVPGDAPHAQPFTDIKPREVVDSKPVVAPTQEVATPPKESAPQKRSVPTEMPAAQNREGAGVEQSKQEGLKEQYEEMRSTLPDNLRQTFTPFDRLTPGQSAQMKAIMDATGKLGTKLGDAVRTNQRLGPALENHHRRLSVLESQIGMLEKNREMTPQLQREINSLKDQYAEESKAQVRSVEGALGTTASK